MPRSKKNPKVDAFLADKDEAKWKDAFTKLRQIALSCPATEEFKWGKPCYTVNGHNVVLMHGFKDYCALLFAKGALLNDPKDILVQQTKNVQAARQIRFKSAKEVTALAGAIKAYLLAAIELEKSGAKVGVQADGRLRGRARIRRATAQHPFPEGRLRDAHSRPPARLPPLFLRRETIRHPRRARGEMRAANLRRQRTERLSRIRPNRFEQKLAKGAKTGATRSIPVSVSLSLCG
ncbi:MAG: DUF1801 domain-containing protein [Lacunisphaera sp.]